MEDEMVNTLPAGSYSMNRGDGPHSYAKNSYYQRGFVDAVKETMSKEIVEKLEINQLLSHSPNSFLVADFGCSTGPNTYATMQIIQEAVELKFKSQGLDSQIPEFQFLFNDLVSNDFNTLFASLPPKRRYYAAGVPGSFHSLLFPKGSLHFAYSACALNWLSEVPKAVLDKHSPAWNKGRVHYGSNKKEVSEAYSGQFEKDFESFLNARAQELADGGLMSLLIPGVPKNTIPFSETIVGFQFEVFGSSFLDMAKMGLISEEKVDSFNLPVYFPSPEELENVIKRNGCFSIERMETFLSPSKHVAIANLPNTALPMRAVFEVMIDKHFGTKISSTLFECYSNKIAEAANSLSPDVPNPTVHFVFLKKGAK